MQNTCEYSKCSFARGIFDSASECCFYIESWWKPLEGEAILLKDCCNKRLFLMIQELSNRLLGVEKSQEEVRNETVWVQVVAEVLGKNSGIDLQGFVQQRQRLQKVVELKKISESEVGE